MALQNSGPISISQIQTEFTGSNPISISEYYRGAGLVTLVTAEVPVDPQSQRTETL